MVKTLCFLGGAAAWTVHLFAAYFVVALDCTSAWDGARLAIAVLTVVFAAAAVGAGWVSVREWSRVQEARSWEHALNEAGGHEGLFFLVGALMAAIFALLIVLGGLSPFLVPVCAP